MRCNDLWNFWRLLAVAFWLQELITPALPIPSEVLQTNSTAISAETDVTQNDIGSRWHQSFSAAKPSSHKPSSGSHKNRAKQTMSPKIGEFQGADVGTWGSFDRHACRRLCQQDQPLSCYYRLVVHNYQRLGRECNRCLSDERTCTSENCIFGDGVATPVMAVNRMLPGPPIEVCENDTVIVDVLNHLSEPTTIHWHGLPMARTPEMDGAPFITQYPIQPSEVYRYEFMAERSGTVWYHSHVGVQRGLGVAGSFLIRQTRLANRQAHLYDFDLVEHTLMIQDIVYNNDFSRVRNILINGKGRNHLNSWPDNDRRNRYERVRVSPGYRYRIRIINNGIFDCPIEFSIENHKMLMISTDGNDIVPIQADSFFMASAERFDFVLEANQYASNYWIRVRGYGDCGAANLYQGAVLHYRGAARNEQPTDIMAASHFGRSAGKDRVVIGFPRDQPVVATETETETETETAQNTRKESASASAKATNVATAALRALEPLPWHTNTRFLTYYTSFGTHTQPNGGTAFQIDDITYQEPQISLLQARDLYDEESYFCNRTAMAASGFNCVRDNCGCTNVVRLPAYRPIEIVAVNYNESPHPLHLHGYSFRLVGQDVLGNSTDLRRIQDIDRRGLLRRTPPDFPAVEKDTVQIPGFGYVILRFLSNNPGYWMFHCHIELHAVAGMTAIFKIGENYQMKRLPPKLRYESLDDLVKTSKMLHALSQK